MKKQFRMIEAKKAAEKAKGKDKKSKYPKNETEPYNPWAVCTDSVGRDDKEKYERCIQHVKEDNKKRNRDDKKSMNTVDNKIEAAINGKMERVAGIKEDLQGLETQAEAYEYFSKMPEDELTRFVSALEGANKYINFTMKDKFLMLTAKNVWIRRGADNFEWGSKEEKEQGINDAMAKSLGNKMEKMAGMKEELQGELKEEAKK